MLRRMRRHGPRAAPCPPYRRPRAWPCICRDRSRRLGAARIRKAAARGSPRPPTKRSLPLAARERQEKPKARRPNKEPRPRLPPPLRSRKRNRAPRQETAARATVSTNETEGTGKLTTRAGPT
jgi:hypothetical protein